MANTSISGLVSGLDTSSIISQLMQVEAKPQTLLKSRLTTEQSTVSTLQVLNAQLAALTTKAHDLATAKAWSPVATTSSDKTVTVTAGGTAAPGALRLTVNSLASTSQSVYSGTAALSAVVVPPTGGPGDPVEAKLSFADGRDPVLVDTTDGTLGSLVTAINDKNAGVTASAVKLDDGTYRLRLVSTATGADSGFTLTQADGSDLQGLGTATTTAGTSASITVGSDTITSKTNTFAGLVEGVDVTLGTTTALGSVVDLTVARDPAKAQAQLQSLVDGANDILTRIGTLTAYNATTKVAGPLAGDVTLRDLRTKVLDAVTQAADGSSMASLGVQTDRSGKITFDTAKFTTAFGTDPGAVASKLGAAGTATTPGFAARIETIAKAASDATTGTVTSAIQSRQSSVTTMQKSIEDWDVRLATKKTSLERQYAALEVSLQKLQSQSTWLAGQISSLPRSSSS